jgi:23S rRNA (guanosine2251-2'-O)-methyltransferase
MTKPHPSAHRRVPTIDPDDGPTLIWGNHAVEAALANPARKINKLMLTENAAHRFRDLILARGLKVETVLPRALDRRLGPDTVHQGALIETEPLDQPELADLAEAAERGPIILLDQVTDPHNVGAILRSAAVFGAVGMVMTRRHSPPLTGVLAKTASGALDAVPVALVQNLARAMAVLKEAGVVLIGLDGDAETDLTNYQWPTRAALVLGAEGRGLRQLTCASCDVVLRIGAAGPLTSLNVSNAAAVALYAAQASRAQK